MVFDVTLGSRSSSHSKFDFAFHLFNIDKDSSSSGSDETLRGVCSISLRFDDKLHHTIISGK